MCIIDVVRWCAADNESGAGVSVAAVRESTDEGGGDVALQPRRQSDRSAQLGRGGHQRPARPRRTASGRRLRQSHSDVHHRRTQRTL